MLGLKSKKVQEPESKVLDINSLKNPRSIEFATKLAQSEHELALMRRVPEMRTQIRDLDSITAGLRKMVTITEAGFDPFRPTKSWYMGFLSKPSYAREGQSYLLYTRAMPEFAVDAYIKAKAMNVFDTFTIHSPDATAFTRHTIPMPRVVDPILVGWIGRPNLRAGGTDWETFDAEGFMIAQWDLAADLAFSQLVLGSPKDQNGSRP